MPGTPLFFHVSVYSMTENTSFKLHEFMKAIFAAFHQLQHCESNKIYGFRFQLVCCRLSHYVRLRLNIEKCGEHFPVGILTYLGPVDCFFG